MSGADDNGRPGNDTTAPPALEVALTDALRRLDQLRFVDDRETELPAANLRLLWLLRDGAPRTLRAVSRELRLEISTVNRQVNAAIRAGLLERLEEKDGAAHLIGRTRAGEAAYEAESERRRRRYARALARMDDGGAPFVAMLREFVTAFDLAQRDDSSDQHRPPQAKDRFRAHD